MTYITARPTFAKPINALQESGYEFPQMGKDPLMQGVMLGRLEGGARIEVNDCVQAGSEVRELVSLTGDEITSLDIAANRTFTKPNGEEARMLEKLKRLADEHIVPLAMNSSGAPLTPALAAALLVGGDKVALLRTHNEGEGLSLTPGEWTRAEFVVPAAQFGPATVSKGVLAERDRSYSPERISTRLDELALNSDQVWQVATATGIGHFD